MDAMLSKALRGFLTGPLNQLIVNLSGKDGEEWGEGLMRFLRKEPYWEVKKTKHIYRILRPIPPTPVATGPFEADKTFFNKKNKSGVKMVEHGSNFRSWFAGKVEEGAPEGILVPLTLTQQSAYDKEIIADLGGEEEAEVLLAEVWRLMEHQANGEKGDLFTDGCANIFYVRDVNGVLRAASVRWIGGGWGVGADALGVCRWSGVARVFSRNS